MLKASIQKKQNKTKHKQTNKQNPTNVLSIVNVFSSLLGVDVTKYRSTIYQASFKRDKSMQSECV